MHSPFEIDPEAHVQIHAWEEQYARMQVFTREEILRFAAVLCSCPRARADPLAVECIVHRAMMWDPFKERYL